MSHLPRLAGPVVLLLSVTLGAGACGVGSSEATPSTSHPPTSSAPTTSVVVSTTERPATTAPTTATPSTDVPDPGEGADPWPESVLARLVVDDQPRREGYDRDDWGGGWSDADRDCLNTRHEVLMTEEIRSSPFLRADGCLVTGGRWFAAFTGTFVDDPRSLDVDHFVPLANAHRSGGWAWDRATKKRYANDLDDPRHLIAVTSSANRSKGDKGPEAWRPPDESYWCDYADTWMDVKVRWGLTVTSAELSALRDMLGECDGDPGAFVPPDAPIEPGDPIDLGVPGDLGPSLGDGSEAGDGTPPNPGDARNCGDFQTYAEAKAWFDAYVEAYGDVARLDRDGDGEPCESLPGGP
ncbi:MAG: hypothetical protein CL466_02285 [Acidimicrobiaceae bacterium]|nr:hypothetical protein [Acidimicrobiaceae bacterium]